MVFLVPDAGGFEDPPPTSSLDSTEENPETPGTFLKGFQELGAEALHSMQGQPNVAPSAGSSQPLSDSARLDSGGAASKSDPGSRDFSLRDSTAEAARGPGQVSEAAEASTSGRRSPTGSLQRPRS